MPFAIATGQGSPIGIAVDDTHVYWTNSSSGEVRKRLKDGTGAITTLGPNSDGAWGIAIDATTVYFAKFASAGGGVAKVNKDNTGYLSLASDASVWGVALADGHVYYTIDAGAVKRVPIAGGSSETLVAAGNAYAIAADADAVYWGDSVAGEVIRYDIATSTPSPIAFGLNNVAGIIVDDTRLFYAQYEASGDVGGMNKNGADPFVLATSQQNVATFPGMDADSVYWSSVSAGKVVRAPKDGPEGAQTDIATGQDRPYGVTADAQFVYWASRGDANIANSGSIQRIAR
jgi:hypothetical protein